MHKQRRWCFCKEVILDMRQQTLYNYKNELNCQQEVLTNQDFQLEVVKFGTWFIS